MFGLFAVKTSKKEVGKLLDGKSVDDILCQIETRHRFADIYERKEKDEYYVYSLKKAIGRHAVELHVCRFMK